MKKVAIAGAVLGAALALVPGVAAAQEEPLGSVELTSPECRQVELTATLAGGVYPDGARFEVDLLAGPNGGGAPSDHLGIIEVTSDNPGSKTLTLERDSYGGEAFVMARQGAGPDRGVFPERVIVVDTSCAREDDQAQTPDDDTPAPPTSEAPEPTEEPAPTDTPDPADEDEDDEVIRNYEFNREETSQVGEVPVGGVDTGMA